MSNGGRAIALVCALIVLAITAMCALWFLVASNRQPRHRPEIWCISPLERYPNRWGDRCDLKLYDARIPETNS